MVPDTNILVDRLESMKELANSGDWSIRVPTMVVIELEHLAEKDVARFWTVEVVDLLKVWISAQPTSTYLLCPGFGAL